MVMERTFYVDNLYTKCNKLFRNNTIVPFQTNLYPTKQDKNFHKTMIRRIFATRLRKQPTQINIFIRFQTEEEGHLSPLSFLRTAGKAYSHTMP